MKAFVYIGCDSKGLDFLRESLKDDLQHYLNINEAIKYLIRDNIDQPILLFYEKTDISEDSINIELLKRSIPTSLIILITEYLNSNDKLDYLKLGVSDVIFYTDTYDRIQRVVKNLVIIKKQIQDHQSSLKYKKIDIFHMPWYKRLFDIFFSLFAIIFFSPLLLFIILAIRLESKGPVVYKSRRVGQNYSIFYFLKFRSMYADADKRMKEYLALNQYKQDDEETQQNKIHKLDLSMFTMLSEAQKKEQNIFVSDNCILSEEEYLKSRKTKQKQAFIKIENDPRVTKVGHIIRKYSLDELPQLINIFKGDMSIVGNRPLPLYEAELLTDDISAERFLGPSGLTGLWQVEKRGDSGRLSADERKELDIKYVRDYSFKMDIQIILKTFTSFIQKENV